MRAFFSAFAFYFDVTCMFGKDLWLVPTEKRIVKYGFVRSVCRSIKAERRCRRGFSPRVRYGVTVCFI
jgi:hypothetical protein